MGLFEGLSPSEPGLIVWYATTVFPLSNSCVIGVCVQIRACVSFSDCKTASKAVRAASRSAWRSSQSHLCAAKRLHFTGTPCAELSRLLAENLDDTLYDNCKSIAWPIDGDYVYGIVCLVNNLITLTYRVTFLLPEFVQLESQNSFMGIREGAEQHLSSICPIRKEPDSNTEKQGWGRVGGII